MALTADQLKAFRHEYVQALGEVACRYDRPQLDQIAAAADQWLTDNAVTYNLALPAFFRTTASPGEKAAVLSLVAMRRAGR